MLVNKKTSVGPFSQRAAVEVSIISLCDYLATCCSSKHLAIFHIFQQLSVLPSSSSSLNRCFQQITKNYLLENLELSGWGWEWSSPNFAFSEWTISQPQECMARERQCYDLFVTHLKQGTARVLSKDLLLTAASISVGREHAMPETDRPLP